MKRSSVSEPRSESPTKRSQSGSPQKRRRGSGRSFLQSGTPQIGAPSSQSTTFAASQYYAQLIAAPRVFASSNVIVSGSDSWDIRWKVPDKTQAKLHGKLWAPVVAAFESAFGPSNGWERVHKDLCWVIVKHQKTGKLLELQLELCEYQFKPFGSYPRTGGVTTIPGDIEAANGQPDGVISLLVDGKRVPIFYLDFKVSSAMSENFGQLSAYMLEGFKRMKSATRQNGIAGGLLRYTRENTLEIFCCDLSLIVPAGAAPTFKCLEWDLPEEITLAAWMERVRTHADVFMGVTCDPQAPLQLLTWQELSHRLPSKYRSELKDDDVAATTLSARHTMYFTGKHYIKVMFEPHLDHDLLVTQATLAQHLREQLSEFPDLMNKWESIELGPHMWAVCSEAAGEKFTTRGLEPERMRRFIRGMLRYCLITPVALEGRRRAAAVVHGDLRPANVTSKLQIVDFEFLGFTRARGQQLSFEQSQEGSNWELTREQRDGDMITTCTNVWQVGLLISQLFVAPLPKDISCAKQVVAFAQQSCLGLSFNEKSSLDFLHRLRSKMVTKAMWCGGKSSVATAKKIVNELLAELDVLEEQERNKSAQHRAKTLSSDTQTIAI